MVSNCCPTLYSHDGDWYVIFQLQFNSDLKPLYLVDIFNLLVAFKGLFSLKYQLYLHLSHKIHDLLTEFRIIITNINIYILISHFKFIYKIIEKYLIPCNYPTKNIFTMTECPNLMVNFDVKTLRKDIISFMTAIQ